MKDPYELVEQGQAALDEGQLEEALQAAEQALAQVPEEPQALFLMAETLLEYGDLAAAEGVYRKLDQLVPGEPAVCSGLGLCLFDMINFDESEQWLRKSLELDEGQAEVHHHLGLLLERQEHPDAAKHLKLASELAPEDFPPPVPMADEVFDQCVEDALDELPDKVQQALDNVNVSVEDLPTISDLTASDPPLSPQLLGLWRGRPLNEKSVFDPGAELPGDIVLYQRNLQRLAGDKQNLVDQIRTTVLHEVGHALGLTEADLAQRGLE